MSLSVSILKRLPNFTLAVRFDANDERMALLGASGSGKSLTLKCIAGLERPDHGRIVLNGRILFDSEDGVDLPPQERRVGLLFQNYALFPNMTVRENLLAAASRLPRRRRDAAAEEKLRAFRLKGQESLYPRQLSGGQQQRVALARVFLSEPECLLLDEPFAALDSYLRWHTELELCDLLLPYAGDVVLVSHDRGEARRLCESVTVLTAGHSEPKTTMRELIDAPRTVSAALIAGCKNITRIRHVGERHVKCLDWGVTLSTAASLAPEHSCAGVSSHRLRFARGDEVNRIEARVVRVIDDAFDVILMLSPDTGSTLLRMEAAREEWDALGRPNRVTLSVAPEHVMPLSGEL